MVRFIIINEESYYIETLRFTFQYGQIYYVFYYLLLRRISLIYIPIWLDLLLIKQFFVIILENYLHSNMVRFIMTLNYVIEKAKEKFTFQYGQIYYFVFIVKFISVKNIYIPIWLDLL